MKKLLALLLLAACSSTKTLEGERTSIFTPSPREDVVKATITLDQSPPLSFEKTAKYDIGSSPDSRITPYPALIATNEIYTLDGSLTVRALKSDKSSKVLKNDSDIKFGSLAFGNNTVFALSNSGTLAALNPDSLATVWKSDFPIRAKSAVALCGNSLVFSGDQNQVYFVNASTGEKIINHRTINDPFEFITGAKPLCLDNKVVVPFSNGELHAFDLAGKHLWQEKIAKIGVMSDIIANPTFAGNLIIAKSYSGVIKAVNSATGKTVWSATSGGTATPTMTANGKVLFDATERTIQALDTQTGKPIWQVKTTLDGKLYSPILNGAQLVITSGEGDAEILNPQTGELSATKTLAGTISADPILYNDSLIIQNQDDIIVYK